MKIFVLEEMTRGAMLSVIYETILLQVDNKKRVTSRINTHLFICVQTYYIDYGEVAGQQKTKSLSTHFKIHTCYSFNGFGEISIRLILKFYDRLTFL